MAGNIPPSTKPLIPKRRPGEGIVYFAGRDSFGNQTRFGFSKFLNVLCGPFSYAFPAGLIELLQGGCNWEFHPTGVGCKPFGLVERGPIVGGVKKKPTDARYRGVLSTRSEQVTADAIDAPRNTNHHSFNIRPPVTASASTRSRFL
jgi:hypothetical protein